MSHTVSGTETMPFVLSPESLEMERIEFTYNLVNHGLMSREFAESGLLDNFELDNETGHDAIKHILVGDLMGGCHHLRTVAELGITNRRIASEIYDPVRPERKIGKFRKEQERHVNGAFRSNIVEIEEDGINYRKLNQIELGGKILEVASGSTMFPDEWSAEDVLGAIAWVAKTPPSEESLKGVSPSLIHKAVVNGVKIKVVTYKETGKIITGTPIIRRR